MEGRVVGDKHRTWVNTKGLQGVCNILCGYHQPLTLDCHRPWLLTPGSQVLLHHSEGTSAAAAFDLHQGSKGHTGTFHPLSPLAAPGWARPLCRQGADTSPAAVVTPMGTAERGTHQALPNALCPGMADLATCGITQATATSRLERTTESPKNWCPSSCSGSSAALIRVKQRCHPVAAIPCSPRHRTFACLDFELTFGVPPHLEINTLQT